MNAKRAWPLFAGRCRSYESLAAGMVLGLIRPYCGRGGGSGPQTANGHRLQSEFDWGLTGNGEYVRAYSPAGERTKQVVDYSCGSGGTPLPSDRSESRSGSRSKHPPDRGRRGSPARIS